MVLVDELIVDATREPVVELGQNLHVTRIGDVQDHDAVTPIRRTLAADDGDTPVLRHLHVVHRSGASTTMLSTRTGAVGSVTSQKYAAPFAVCVPVAA